MRALIGVPEADRVATPLDPVIEGYLSEASKQTKGVTQVTPFVRAVFLLIPGYATGPQHMNTVGLMGSD